MEMREEVKERSPAFFTLSAFHSSGFFLADAVMALVILSLLAGVLMMSAGRQRHASLRLKDQRTAMALAERGLSRMRAGVAAGDATVQVERLGDGDAPSGQRWVRVKAVVHGREASVVGLAPVEAVKEVGHE
jgi:Tfp pilus assembly protein PilX